MEVRKEVLMGEITQHSINNYSSHIQLLDPLKLKTYSYTPKTLQCPYRTPIPQQPFGTQQSYSTPTPLHHPSTQQHLPTPTASKQPYSTAIPLQHTNNSTALLQHPHSDSRLTALCLHPPHHYSTPTAFSQPYSTPFPFCTPQSHGSYASSSNLDSPLPSAQLTSPALPSSTDCAFLRRC
ncbi:hypothetical protein AGOR_G00145080 [Albula goreensis]|uniref:Uncharacterized protein n=1 Tax=Albula goreensis TaxID=1534307 RepID=A0A8T3D1Q5_9TELE|nr:hypothetical protein AGOR_G00145080 [Albula goreensis]